MNQVTDVVDLQSPDDVALADKMKTGRDRITAELRNLRKARSVVCSSTRANVEPRK